MQEQLDPGLDQGAATPQADTLAPLDALSTVRAEEPQATFLGGSDLSASSDLSAQATRSHVSLYQDIHFGGGDPLDLTGPSFVNLNDYYINWPWNTWNNATSSLVVGPHTKATFYAALDSQGTNHTLGPGSYDLDALKAHGIPNDWISSVAITNA